MHGIAAPGSGFMIWDDPVIWYTVDLNSCRFSGFIGGAHMGDSQERTTVLRKQRPDTTAEGIRSAALPSEPSQDWLGRSLKQLFDNIASEPIPQRIVDKLQELEQKE